MVDPDPNPYDEFLELKYWYYIIDPDNSEPEAVEQEEDLDEEEIEEFICEEEQEVEDIEDKQEENTENNDRYKNDKNNAIFLEENQVFEENYGNLD